MSGEKIGYDELLDSRVKQLREIDQRLEAMLRRGIDNPFKAVKDIRELRNDIAVMIRAAEEESAAF